MQHKLLIDEALLADLANANGLVDPSIAIDWLDGSGRSLRIAPGRRHYPASMIKVPIAMVLAALCEAGAYALSDTRTIDRTNMTANDAASPFVTGYRAELGELARGMLSASDNVATNELIDALGRDTITRACLAFGLPATAVHRKLSGSLPLLDDPPATGRNAHPAADAALAFAVLAREMLRRQGWVYDALLAQQWNGKLSAGWREDDRFAHKTGDTDEVSHDGGILHLADGRCFVVVVYTAMPATPETDARFARFARALRPHLAA